METEKRDDELECLKKEIRLFRKKEKAIFDMIFLYEILNTDRPINNLIGITLIERVLKNLEDKSLKIPYKTTSIFHLLIILQDQYYEIVNKEENNKKEYKHYIQKFSDEYNYKEIIVERDLNRITMLKGNEEFNLIQMVLSKSPQLVYKFLISKIPFNTRLEMFQDVLSAKQDKNYEEFFNSDNINFLTKEEKRKLPKRMKKLVKKATGMKNKKRYIENLLNNQEKNDATIKNWPKSEHNILEEQQKDKDTINNMYLTFVSYMLHMKENIHTFKNLYEGENYLEVYEKNRTNSDLLIINSLHLVYLPIFIKFPHFVVTEEKIEFLKIRIIKELSSIDITDLESKKETYQKILQEIAKAIISKAKNKKEYKQFCTYAKSFIEVVDIEKKIQPLNEKRRELSTLLYRMNDYAQENIPGKRLIKEIKDFRK